MTGQDGNIEQQISNCLYGTRPTSKHKRKTAQYKERKEHEGQVSTVKETRTGQGDVTKGITGTRGRHKQRQSNELRYKTTKETLNKDNTDKAAGAELWDSTPSQCLLASKPVQGGGAL